MPRLILGAASLNQTPLDLEGNVRRIGDAIDAAKEQGVNLLVLPELCITGYGCEDAFFYPSLLEQARDALVTLAKLTRDIFVAVGVPIAHEGRLYNAACLLGNGAIHGFVCKKFLAGDGIHYEPRWFTPWRKGVSSSLTIGKESYPLGDLVFDIEGARIGFEICEDAWVSDRPASILKTVGVNVLLAPSASHFAFGKSSIRRRLVEDGSRIIDGTCIFANVLGNESGRAIYDGDCLIAHRGDVVASGPRFIFGDYSLVTCAIEIDPCAEPSIKEGALPVIVELREKFASTEKRLVKSDPSASWEGSRHLKEEEFFRAVTLGLFDYMRKSRSHGFVLSLSGGADSGAIACLVALMVERLVVEKGDAWIRNVLSFPENAEVSVSQFLTTIYQALPHSSVETRAAAASLALSIGSSHHEFSLEEVHQGYLNEVSGKLGVTLNWEKDDIPLQNLQARVRVPGLWLVANLKRALLLCTSNRSEAAVGYCTMDGDSCGGLAPIAGIDKHFLREWLVWLEKTGPTGFHAFPALSVINCQAPTAELRPAGMHQTDEKDLMPYEVLALFERKFLLERRSPGELSELAEATFGKRYQRKELDQWAERFFTLWRTSQWKRERYAPSFHLDQFSVDPKTWCRYPILSAS